MSVILLSGKAGSGKTTFANHLHKTYPDTYFTFALADKLKELTYKLLKIFDVPIASPADLDNRETKERYRSYMQLIGTEAIRSTFGNDFWCEQLYKEIDACVSNGFCAIISDVRFPDEQEYFRSRFPDCKCVMIRRDAVDNIKATHSSENTDKLRIDEVMFNNGTIEEFEHLIDCAFGTKEVSNTDNVSDDQLIDLPEEIELPEVPIVERAMILESDNEDYTIKPTDQMKDKFVHSSAPIAANDSKFISMMTTNNDKNSSQQLGVIGEHYVLELLQQIKPRNETILVSTMPHVADLHSIDYINNIFWVIEVKNKSNLTPEDVDKFKRDLERMTQQHANDKLKCIGLFLSLRSTSIPKIGDLYVDGNEIYLSKTYFTPETVKIVFNFVEQYQTLLNAKNNSTTLTGGNTETTSRPAFTAEDLELLALLNTEYQHLTRDIELYTSIRSNCSANLQHVEELTASARMKQRLIYCLNRQLSASDDIIDRTTESIQYNAFIDYIKTQSNKNNIKKTLILQRFPALMTSINRIGWNEYRDEAWATAKNEPKNITTSTTSPADEQPTEQTAHDSHLTFNSPELIQYVAALPSKNKLLKKDILANFSETRKDIQAYGWAAFRDNLWSIAHANN